MINALSVDSNEIKVKPLGLLGTNQWVATSMGMKSVLPITNVVREGKWTWVWDLRITTLPLHNKLIFFL